MSSGFEEVKPGVWLNFNTGFYEHERMMLNEKRNSLPASRGKRMLRFLFNRLIFP